MKKFEMFACIVHSYFFYKSSSIELAQYRQSALLLFYVVCKFFPSFFSLSFSVRMIQFTKLFRSSFSWILLYYVRTRFSITFLFRFVAFSCYIFLFFFSFVIAVIFFFEWNCVLIYLCLNSFLCLEKAQKKIWRWTCV